MQKSKNQKHSSDPKTSELRTMFLEMQKKTQGGRFGFLRRNSIFFKSPRQCPFRGQNPINRIQKNIWNALVVMASMHIECGSTPESEGALEWHILPEKPEFSCLTSNESECFVTMILRPFAVFMCPSVTAKFYNARGWSTTFGGRVF
jgi:hypothetical protein